MQRIGQYEDGDIEYNLLSLCQSPLKTIRRSLVENANLILDVEKILSAVVPDWKLHILSRTDLAWSMEELATSLDVSTDQIKLAEPAESVRKQVEEASSNPEKLFNLYKDLVLDQKVLRSECMQELESIAQEDEQATDKKQDHTPVVYMAIKALAEVGVLRDIVKDLRERRTGDA